VRESPQSRYERPQCVESARDEFNTEKTAMRSQVQAEMQKLVSLRSKHVATVVEIVRSFFPESFMPPRPQCVESARERVDLEEAELTRAMAVARQPPPGQRGARATVTEEEEEEDQPSLPPVLAASTQKRVAEPAAEDEEEPQEEKEGDELEKGVDADAGVEVGISGEVGMDLPSASAQLTAALTATLRRNALSAALGRPDPGKAFAVEAAGDGEQSDRKADEGPAPPNGDPMAESGDDGTTKTPQEEQQLQQQQHEEQTQQQPPIQTTGWMLGMHVCVFGCAGCVFGCVDLYILISGSGAQNMQVG